MTRRTIILAAAASVVALGIWVRCGPLPEGFLDPERHTSTEVVARGGERLYEALSEEGGRTRWLTADALPETLVRATLAAEDARFFSHAGVDPIAVARAAWHDLKARRIVEGGSTITQQVVKQLSNRRRTAVGKMKEMLLALRLEHRVSKREVLALYLNLAPYGNQLLGAAAASRAYFGTDPENLTPAQAAFLAGLPQRPTAFDPYAHLERAQARQRRVLAQMQARGWLTQAETTRARAERLRLRRDARTLLAAHFVERVLSPYRSAPARRIETTLDAALQAEIQGILSAQAASLREHGAANVAVAVLENATGEWLAWEGSGDWLDSEHGGTIDGVVSPRQPGSTLKPFTYALAFESGMTPADPVPDVPAHFPTAEKGVLYSPRNYDGSFRGPLSARSALAGSVNVPAVWTLSKVGVPNLLRLLRSAGFTTLSRNSDYYGYGLTMGDAEVRLDELVAGYSIFANGGLRRAPRMVRRIVRADGSSAAAPFPAPERVVSERAAYWIADVLSDPRARAFVFGTGGSLDFPFPVAVKTGTSQAYRDNWTVGFTRDVTVGVWVGNFDRRELRNSSGVTGAAPIFHAVMLEAQKRAGARTPADAGSPLLRAPDDLVPVTVCALSGMPAGRDCPTVATEILPGASARRTCTWHRRAGRRVAVLWPPEYRAWAKERGLLDERAPAAAGTAHAGEVGAPLTIANPPADAVYLRDPTLRSGFQTLPLRAVAQGEPRALTWSVDGRLLGRISSDAVLEWPLAAGEHRIEVEDGRGHSAETAIRVK